MARFLTPVRRRGRPAGFTLVEAMVTLLVAAVGFMAINRLQTITANNAIITSQGNEAVHLAQDKLNYFRSNGHYALIVANASAETITGTNATFTRTYSMTECAVATNGADLCSGPLSTTVAHYKKVTVQVSWTDITGTPRFVLLSSNFSAIESAPSAGFFS